MNSKLKINGIIIGLIILVLIVLTGCSNEKSFNDTGQTVQSFEINNLHCRDKAIADNNLTLEEVELFDIFVQENYKIKSMSTQNDTTLENNTISAFHDYLSCSISQKYEIVTLGYFYDENNQLINLTIGVYINRNFVGFKNNGDNIIVNKYDDVAVIINDGSKEYNSIFYDFNVKNHVVLSEEIVNTFVKLKQPEIRVISDYDRSPITNQTKMINSVEIQLRKNRKNYDIDMQLTCTHQSPELKLGLISLGKNDGEIKLSMPPRGYLLGVDDVYNSMHSFLLKSDEETYETDEETYEMFIKNSDSLRFKKNITIHCELADIQYFTDPTSKSIHKNVEDSYENDVGMPNIRFEIPVQPRFR